MQPVIVYGTAPAGWTVRQPALPLAAGCYEVFTMGGGIGADSKFWVGSSGAIDSIRS